MFNTDSFGNIYFPAGVSVGNYPIVTTTPTHVLIAGAGGRISRVATSQLISNTDVTSVFGRKGDVIALPGDYTSEMVKEVRNLYFTNGRARAAISLTALGTSGPATYNPVTGVINVPQYQNEFNGVTTFNGRAGAVTLTALDVTTALTYTPLATEADPIWTAQKPLYYTKVETESYVTTQISNLVDSAPTTLNTLNELAAALGDDANFSTTITNLIGTKEPAITPGTTTQYWRGDKTWQTLPIYTLAGLGGVPTTRTLTINGTGYDLSADRSWTINSMVYPPVGIAVSTGSSWAPSITDNSSNWNTAFSDRMKWDGGSAGLNAATGRTSLGLGTAATANTGDFAAASHTHIIANVTGLQTALDGKEPTITAGTTLQYWRGDKSWQTLPIYTLSGLGGEPIITAGTTSQYWRGDKTWQTLPVYTLSGLGGQPLDADLTAIAALAGTSGFLKKTATDTWALDTNTYLTTGTAATTYEPVITAGTTAQYWRGDKSWQTLPSYSLPTASASVLGGIKVGANLSIDGNGVLSAGNSYVLPTASATVLGGIKVGTNLSIDANGVLSSTDTNTTYANFTRTVSGLVPNPGGATTNRYLREDGTWVIPPDTDTTYTLVGLGGQPQLNGTGFVKANGTTISYDNSTYYLASNPAGYITSASIGNGTLTLNVSGNGLSGSTSFTANQSGNSTFTVTSNATTSATANTLVYRDSGADIYTRYFFGSYINTSDNDESSITRFIIKNGDNYHRSATTTVAANIIRGVASGTWTIDITGSATAANYLTSSNYTNQRGSNGSWNADFQATPAGAYSYGGDLGANGTNGPGGTWWIQQNFRHTNSSSFWGVQVAWGWEDNANRLATRNVTGGNYGSWIYYLNSANYNSYSPTLTGVGASGTWTIAITGNAGSITNQANSATITASTGVTASHIVQRDANGYIYANYINFSTSESENPTISSFFTSNGDGWSRKSSIAHVRNQLGNYGGWITASALTGYLPLTGGTLTGPLGGTTATFSGSLGIGISPSYEIHVNKSGVDAQIVSEALTANKAATNNALSNVAGVSIAAFGSTYPESGGSRWAGRAGVYINIGKPNQTFNVWIGSRTIINSLNTGWTAIGQNDPQAFFHVQGDALVGGSVTATSFFESSDATLKTLVQDNYQAKGIDSVVAKLYIKNGKEELGYYAQDLQAVLPSAVSKSSDGLLNLSYREVHTAKIAYLEEKIKQLEKLLSNALE